MRYVMWLLIGTTVALTRAASAADNLERQFADPPEAARAWCYWWWLNGAASKEGITRDFQQMKKQGISGALLFDAGQTGPDAPRGPQFMSPAWRELYRHAVGEAGRLGIVLGVNLCSGWNAGGPWVTPERAAKRLVAVTTVVNGPGHVTKSLPQPSAIRGYYRDVVVLAQPLPAGASQEPRLTASSTYRDYVAALAQDGRDDTRWISYGDRPGMGPTAEKPEYLQFDYAEAWPAAGLYLNPFSDCGPKEIEIQVSDDGRTYRSLRRATVAQGKELTVAFDEVQGKHFRVVFLSAYPYLGQASWNVQVAEIALLNRRELKDRSRGSRGFWDRSRAIDLTSYVDREGRLTWHAPPGTWSVLRIGYTLLGSQTQCVGSGPGGLEIDTMSAAAMDAHFAETGVKLIADAGTLAGKTLQYFHIDSWELGQPTWTPSMREEFQRRRGYDPLRYLPALVQRTVDSPAVTRRFLHDYRQTVAELVAANYYGRLRELTLKGGLRGTHPESGGPFFTHWIDALQCEGINDIPMGEFWKRNAEPDGPITHLGNPSLKQAACTAHIYGKPVCQAEAFTSFACDWIDDPWSMKDIGDAAFCAGLTRNVLCFWVHQPRLEARPGFQWAHVGTHFDCNLTWWEMSHAWLAYLARCQYLLRQGRFVADFAYFQGEEIPAFLAADRQQEPLRPAGFDYDVLNTEVLLQRAAAKDGRLALPDGMSYRYLVLPHDAPLMSPPVLRKIQELVEGGVTVIGPRPERAPGLGGYPQCDEEVGRLADALWGSQHASSGQRRVGTGRVLWGCKLEDVVQGDHLPPDVEFRAASAGAKLDWIHRRDSAAEICFLSNQAAVEARVEVLFRITGKQPELWDAVTGRLRDLLEWRQVNGRTAVPMRFAPRQSFFVVFRKETHGPGNGVNFPVAREVAKIEGPWEVSFDPKWGGPEKVVFATLDDWTRRPEEGIRYYSGTVVYRKTFGLATSAASEPESTICLDLGTVKNLARVSVNGRDCGIVWTAPWQAEITTAVRPGKNDLQVEVVNLWPNRLIGDALLPKEKRRTVTNVRTYDTLTSGTYGCKICEARQAAGRPAELLPSGLLGPVRIIVVR